MQRQIGFFGMTWKGGGLLRGSPYSAWCYITPYDLRWTRKVNKKNSWLFQVTEIWGDDRTGPLREMPADRLEVMHLLLLALQPWPCKYQQMICKFPALEGGSRGVQKMTTGVNW